MSTSAQRTAHSQSPLNGPGRIRPATHMYRAAYAAVKAAAKPFGNETAAQMAEKIYPGDPVTPRLLLRGVTTPATIASATWAGAVAAEVPIDFVSSLAPESAAALLISAGVRLSLEGIYEVALPRRNGVPTGDGVLWTAEGVPLPVKGFTIATGLLGPVRKMGSIVAITRELAEHSTAEAVIQTLLQEDAAASLDASMFSNTAASASRPAGLLNGVTPITATSGGGATAMTADLLALVGAISDAGGGSPIFIGSPKMALAASLVSNSNPDIVVWPSRALTGGTIIAIEPRAFASAFGPEPDITASTEPAFHMDDAAPAPIAVTGTPNTVSAPVRSMYQTDCVALKMILRAAWTMRAPGMVQYITGATWGS